MKDYKDKIASVYNEKKWPGKDSEEWRRTDISSLDIDGYAENPGVVKEACYDLPENISSGILICNDFLADRRPGDSNLSMDYSISPEIDYQSLKSMEKIELLHALNNSKKLKIHAEGRKASSVFIQYTFSGSDSLHSPFIELSSSPGASLTAVLLLDQDESDMFINGKITVNAGSNSKISIFAVNSGGSKAGLFLDYNLNLSRDSEISFYEFHHSSRFVKTRLSGNLDGPGANLRLNGASIASENSHMDLCIYQNHNSHHTFSDAVYRGITFPGSYTVFQGLINVEENAAGTDAYLTNKNILTDDGARADSIPKLRIKTNDVKCSHGSSTGKIDQDQLFYLQSRGFSVSEAREMLLTGFFSEIIDKYPEIVKYDLENDIQEILLGF